MASSVKPLVVTKTANGAINPLSFVKLDTASPGAGKTPNVVQCGAGDSPWGVAQNEALAAIGDSIEVAVLGGGARLTVSGTITAGQSIKSDSSGYGLAASAAGDRCGAQAVESGVANDIIGVHVNRFEKHNADAT